MLTNDVNVVRYLVSGNTYAIPFPYWKTSDIKAYITLADETVQPLVYGTDFTVTTPDAVSGTLTKVSAWTDAAKLTIIREVELTQEIDLINGEKIDGEELEKGLDLKAAGLQQMQEQLSRSVMTSVDEPGTNIIIPNTEARKGTGDGTIMGFDGTGGGVLLRDLKQFDQDVAATAANAASALASKNKAQEWAENPEDTPVEPGSYSAKHWATKAAGSASSASASATTATSEALDSEAYAIGKRGGQDVPASDPAYHNNTKYYYDLVVGAISGALRYQGTWTTTGATDYSGIPTPRVKGDLYYCQGTACTIDGVTYTQGDLIIFNQDVASTITTSAIDKIDNTETVTPDNTCTLENKTIPLGDNDITTTANKVIVSDADGNIGAGSVDAAKIVSTDGSQTLKNKTIAGNDNTITMADMEVTANTTLNPTKELSVRVTTENAVVTLSDAPYRGYRLPIINKAAAGIIKVTYTNAAGGTVTDALNVYGMAVYENVGGSAWTPADGSTFRVFSNLTSSVNNWKTFRGAGTYTFFYSASDIDSVYDLPISWCTITVTWGASSTASAIAVQNYHSSGNENNVVPIWTCNYSAGTWSNWFKIMGNGSGTVTHKTSLASGWTGDVYWTVKNGICMLDCYAKCSSTGTSKTVLTNVPKAKMSVHACSYAARGLVFIESGTTTLKSHVTTANENQVAHLAYPVADDWVES